MLVGQDSTLASDYIEECIDKKDNLLKVLRLLCLLSLTGDGLKSKQHEFFKREIAQTYGFEYAVVLGQLERLGLYRREGGKGTVPYSTLRKTFNLISEANEAAPSDISYVYSGYAPLSVRMVQSALRGSTAWRELNQKIPQYGFFEETQAPNPGQRERPAASANRNQVVMVFFVGGVCFTEISAIRFLQQIMPGFHILIGTTKMLNGDVLLTDAVLDQIETLKRSARR